MINQGRGGLPKDGFSNKAYLVKSYDEGGHQKSRKMMTSFMNGTLCNTITSWQKVFTLRLFKMHYSRMGDRLRELDNFAKTNMICQQVVLH